MRAVSTWRTRTAGVVVALLCLAALPGRAVPLVDSLRTLLRQPDLAPGVKARVLYDLYWEMVGHKPDSARLLAQQGLELARARRDANSEVGFLNVLGDDATRQGDLVTGQRYFTQAIRRARVMGARARIWFSYYGLGRVAEQNGQHTRAREFMERALRECYQLRPVPEHTIGEITSALGCVLMEAQDAVGAERHFRQALALHQRLGYVPGQVGTLTNLASLRTTPTPQAVRYLEQALTLAASIRDDYGQCVALHSLASRTLQRTDLPPRQATAEAAYYAERACALAHRVGALPLEVSATELLANIQHRQDDPSAFRTLQRHNHLHDSLFSREKEEMLARLQSRYDLQQREARIQQLEKEKQLVALAHDREQGRVSALGITALSLLTLLLSLGVLIALLMRSRQRLQVSELALRVANRTKDQLMSVIGHDLRGPVAAMQQVTPLLRYHAQRADPAALIELVDEMESGARSLGTLLDNLLHWARDQAGQVVSQPAALPVNSVVYAVEALYRTAIMAKHQLFVVQVEPADLEVWADRDLLATVLRNLVANAVKFTPGGGEIRLTVVADEEANLARFAVIDTGQGIEPERLPRLFTPVAGNSTLGTHGEAGTGLGLPVCARFTALMGGELRVASELGRGTTFSFAIALVPRAAGVPATVSPLSGRSG